ncbi:septum formation family protein [Planosporangium thailandense]|uniref:Septum formation family protein n=1 Tax=Planosporangium thailandense TaxID=765197 RepID=A0ABX0Y0M4_9ACTN|nr:septum formation family protein [Planosporangium thailandense]NJC71707.1 septum formation family protein [Planosporangium thailandense]
MAAAVLAGGLLALAGCALPPGVDGDLTNNWSAFPAAKVAAPTVGQCLQGDLLAGTVDDSPRVPIDCARAHTLEVVYVGHFTGPAAAAAAPPTRDSADARAAFAECGRAANDYLGGDWHDGRLYLHYAEPTTTQWQGGARFFSCSVFEVGSLVGGSLGRTGSLKGGLSGDQPLAMRCFDQQGEIDADGFYTDADAVAIGCDQQHTVEYAGKYVPPDGPYPATEEAMNRLAFAGCVPVLAGFLGQSVNALTRRTDVREVTWSPTEDQWRLGDRTVSCFVTVPAKHPVRGSLKLLGGRPLPA